MGTRARPAVPVDRKRWLFIAAGGVLIRIEMKPLGQTLRQQYYRPIHPDPQPLGRLCRGRMRPVAVHHRRIREQLIQFHPRPWFFPRQPPLRQPGQAPLSLPASDDPERIPRAQIVVVAVPRRPEVAAGCTGAAMARPMPAIIAVASRIGARCPVQPSEPASPIAPIDHSGHRRGRCSTRHIGEDLVTMSEPRHSRRVAIA